MNSVPILSHHLFVAAIGNVSRAQEKPTYHPEPVVGTADGSVPSSWEHPYQGRRPMPNDPGPALRGSISRPCS